VESLDDSRVPARLSRVQGLPALSQSYRCFRASSREILSAASRRRSRDWNGLKRDQNVVIAALGWLRFRVV
jgi:hypothetical protein